MSTVPVLRAAHVRRSPADAFRLFTDQIGAWWPLPTHGLFGDRAGGLSFVDGRLVERSVGGDETVWAEVVAWEPPTRLVMTWHPGRDDGPASTVEVHFVGDDDGTRVEVTHHGWEAFGERAAAARGSYVGPNAWGFVLDHYADVADRDHPGAEGLAALHEAYDTFFAEAERGGFGPAADGGWSAAQVVAHMIVNDETVAAVTRSLIAGKVVAFENAAGNDTTVLDAVVARAGGDLGALVARGVLLGRLDDEQLATPVPCHLLDGGEVRFDQPMPWGQMMLGVQPTRHVPGHTAQLSALRT